MIHFFSKTNPKNNKNYQINDHTKKSEKLNSYRSRKTLITKESKFPSCNVHLLIKHVMS